MSPRDLGRSVARRRLARAPAACGVLLCLLVASGCSKQGEGERCDLNNGPLDCEDNLVCKGEQQLSIQGRGVALCCPAVVDEATVDACRATPTFPAEADAGPTAEPQTETPAPEADAGAEPDGSPAP